MTDSKYIQSKIVLKYIQEFYNKEDQIIYVTHVKQQAGCYCAYGSMCTHNYDLMRLISRSYNLLQPEQDIYELSNLLCNLKNSK